MFGSDLKSDFLVNMASRDGSISIFIRASYIVILNVHIPYFFFTVKEYILVLIDEIKSRSLSIHLEAKLEDFYKKKQQKPTTKKEEDDHPLITSKDDTPLAAEE